MTTTQPTQPDAVQRLIAIRDELATGLMDRNDEANGLAVAYAAQTHALLLGPPGSAKSMVARMFAESTMPADAPVQLPDSAAAPSAGAERAPTPRWQPPAV